MSEWVGVRFWWVEWLGWCWVFGFGGRDGWINERNEGRGEDRI